MGVETIFTFILCSGDVNRKRKKRGLEGLRPLRHGRPIFFGKGPKPLLPADWLAARARIAMRGTRRGLNYCAIFNVYTKFTKTWPWAR
jgi:hypothetical protein